MRRWSLIWACLRLCPSILSPRRQSQFSSAVWSCEFSLDRPPARQRDWQSAECKFEWSFATFRTSLSQEPFYVFEACDCIALASFLEGRAGFFMCCESRDANAPPWRRQAFRMPCWKPWPWRSLAWPRAFTACPKWWWMGRRATALKLARRACCICCSVQFHGVLEVSVGEEVHSAVHLTTRNRSRFCHSREPDELEPRANKQPMFTATVWPFVVESSKEYISRACPLSRCDQLHTSKPESKHVQTK